LIYGPSFTDDQRTASKITNFSLIYEIPENIGYMLSKSLSAATKKNVTRDEAQKIADMIFGRYKRLREWMQERHKAGMSQGGAYTKWRGLDARFRPLPNLGLPYSGDRNDPNKPLVETAIRSTWNMPVQGTAADLTTAALSPIVRWIQDSGAEARLLVTIHDSVVGIVHESALADYISVARQAMTAHAGWLGVKLNADVKTGKRLGQMQKYKVE
jgi:DNA polymerase-1